MLILLEIRLVTWCFCGVLLGILAVMYQLEKVDCACYPSMDISGFVALYTSRFEGFLLKLIAVAGRMPCWVFRMY